MEIVIVGEQKTRKTWEDSYNGMFPEELDDWKENFAKSIEKKALKKTFNNKNVIHRHRVRGVRTRCR